MSEGTTKKKGMYTMIIVLTMINFLNYMDRQIIFPLFSAIKADFSLTDFQLGLLGTIFIFVFALFTIPFGMLADKKGRKFIVACGVMFWSITTFLTGLVKSFGALLFMRGMIGVGEASYNPAATAMLTDNFSHKIRARLQGIFQLGAFAGGTVGTIIGGMILYYTSNWRLAFFIVGIPGLFLAFSSLFLKDKFVPDHEAKIPVLTLLKNKAFLLVLISGAFSAFSASAYISWGVEYVHRYTSYNLRDASIFLGIFMVIAGSIGIYVGSHLADVLQTKRKDGRSILIAYSLLLCVPFLIMGFLQEGPGLWFFASFTIGICLMSFYLGPSTAIIHDLTKPRARATAFALYLFVIHLFGETPAPALIGKISDLWNLKYAMLFATCMLFIGGLIFVAVARQIRTDKIVLYE